MDGLRSASQGPSGQPAEAGGGRVSPSLLESTPSATEDPEGQERDRSESLDKEVLGGDAVQAASGGVCLALPVSDPLVRLPLVPEASCPIPGPKEGRAVWGAPPFSRSEGCPEAGRPPAPGQPSSPQTSPDASDSSDPGLGVGTSRRPGADSGPPDTAEKASGGLAPLPPGPSQAAHPLPGCSPQASPGEGPRDQIGSASGGPPASQSDREPELSESWTRTADTFWNSWREGHDRLPPEEGVQDRTGDPGQVPAADSHGEPGAKGAVSWGRGLAWRCVGGAASSAAGGAAERERGVGVTPTVPHSVISVTSLSAVRAAAHAPRSRSQWIRTGKPRPRQKHQPRRPRADPLGHAVGSAPTHPQTGVSQSQLARRLTLSCVRLGRGCARQGPTCGHLPATWDPVT